MNWMLRYGEQYHGPITAEEFMRLYDGGLLPVGTEATREGEASWVAVEEARQHLKQAAGTSPVPLLRAAMAVRWQDKGMLVTKSETVCPHRCICCGARAEQEGHELRLWWHPPAYYLLLCLGVVPYLILYFWFRQERVFHVGLCKQHRRGLYIRNWVAWVTALAGITLTFCGIMLQNLPPWSFGVIVLPIGIACGMLANPVRIKHIGGERVWLTGVSEGIVEEQPALNPQREVPQIPVGQAV